jgi:translation initiation factor IF-3
VQLVSEHSESLLPPESPRAILARMDRKTDFLVEVAAATGTGLPVCRILPKKLVREYEKAKRQKPRSRSKRMKMLELSWAIGQNDLKHKFDKMKEFFEEGRKVELIIAKRRRGRDATEGERIKLLDCIRTFAQSLDGVREYKAIEWKGKKEEEEGETQVQVQVRKKPRQETAILSYEGTRKPKSTKRPDVDDDDDAAT